MNPMTFVESSMSDFGYNNWILVFINVAFFGGFVLFTLFRKKVAKLPASMYLAFVVALYTEMYGFPLTIYVLSWLFGYQNPLTHVEGHIFAGITGENVFFSVLHPLSSIMMATGILLAIYGWRQIHGSKGRLVMNGIYAYVRHPQYLGILILTIGMLVQWVTIPTLIMWPILAILYYRLARKEEKEIEQKFCREYAEYKAKVPMFLPLRI